MTEERQFTILIIEDEVMISMMLEELLDALGHKVHAVASTLDDALEKIAQGGFDLVIADIHLDGEEVWPAMDMLDEAGIALILSSGGSLGEIPSAYVGRPMLAKPYTMGAISEILLKIGG